MSLNLKEGNAYIIAEMKDNPYNLMATYIADYEDCLLLLFNGDKNDLTQRKSHLETRLSILDKGDKRSPWYRICKAGLYLHWAFVNIRFGENFKAANNFRKSYSLLKQNRQLYPGFVYNDIFFGLEETIVGTVPDEYKWIASIFGIKGNVKKGVQRLNSFISTNDQTTPLYNEAVIYYCYLKFYLMSEQAEVWNFVNNKNNFPLKDNLLHQFVKANIALNFRKADAAIETLNEAQKNPSYRMFPIFDYEMGSAYLHKTDVIAVRYFEDFLKRFHGNFFVKDCWQKIAQAYYINNDLQKATSSKDKILIYGTAVVDADKQAQRFAEENKWPDKRLLGARLLIDGGYYKEALEKLGKYKEVHFNTIVDKLEYNFRLGRIYDELGKDQLAFKYYQAVYNAGKGRKEHFAARAALQMAFIFEKQNNKPAALQKYNDCLSLKGHDFQNSIDQQAKAGINRLQ